MSKDTVLTASGKLGMTMYYGKSIQAHFENGEANSLAPKELHSLIVKRWKMWAEARKNEPKAPRRQPSLPSIKGGLK